MTLQPATTAISCGGAGYKGVFAHGVLSALETHGFRAAAYAGGSAAAIAATLAATSHASTAGAAIWLRAMELINLPGNTLSDVLLALIADAQRQIAPGLAGPAAGRLCIATTSVRTVAGVIETQGARAGALGRRLQVHAARNDRAWATEHLTTHLWDTAATDKAHLLTAQNSEEVLYASTRLLHACPYPAEVDGLPFVDAIYTCACPALEMTALEYRDVIAISSDPGPLYRDLFQSAVIPEMAWRSRIRIICPQREPKAFGVEDSAASEQGLVGLYDHGVDQGLKFLTEHIEAVPSADPRWNWPKRQEPARPDPEPTSTEDPGPVIETTEASSADSDSTP